jgi:hypothetical protein
MANIKIYHSPEKIEISLERLQQEFQKSNLDPGRIWLLTGNAKIFRVAIFLTAMSRQPVALIDGANRFDGYFLVEVARRTRQDYREVLKRFHISRTFTCYQTESTIVERLDRFLSSIRSGLVVILGLLDTYYDDQVPLQEASRSLDRVCRKLRQLRNRGVSILLASIQPDICPKGREKFFRKMQDITEKMFWVENVEHIQTLPTPETERIPRHGSNPTDVHEHH